MGLAVTCLVVLPAWGGDVEPGPDVVELADGRKQEGRVVFEDDERLILQVRSRETEIPKADVASVRAALRDLPRALDDVAALTQGDLIGHHALAEMFDELNLPYEARLVDWLIVDQWPDDELAHERLDHRRKGKGWAVRHSGRWVKLEDRKRMLDDWGDAWELRSTHFRVRTNFELRRAVETLFDLERTYRAFYRFLGEPLELWEITDPIEADVHANLSSFPESIGNGRSFFSPQERKLYVYAPNGAHKGTVVHEATHALLFFSAVYTRSSRGDIPGWLDEGLAEYMQAGVSNQGLGLEFALGPANMAHFRNHAGAEDPIRLGRVLNMRSDDFGGTSDIDLKYAQSYTLVHYCLHGEGGALRERFFDFLRSAYAGKSSSTTFKKVMGIRERDFEAAWSAYVASSPR